MTLSRRNFLLRIGQAGGYSAAFVAMQGLGLAPAKAEVVKPIAAARGVGKGRSVVVVGGGIAGLVSAYELRELGFHVTVLEARGRPGGRNWTVRGGDKIELTDSSVQQCEFGPGLYQNVGPARLPSVHSTILGYCRKFGVAMEVEVNLSRGNRLQNDAVNGGKPVAQRQADNDTRGSVAELLMKSLGQGNLDAAMTAEDRVKMLDFLRFYGPLDKDGKYQGNDRAGYTKYMGAGDDTGIYNEPLDLHTLLDAHFWNGMMFTEEYDQQATMFQPVGGMDHIPRAFARELGAVVRYHSPVTEMRRRDAGVRVGYKEHGVARVVDAEFCICALPMTMARKVPNDFSSDYKRVIETSTYTSAYKVAWESRRFWEQEQNIYGGLEFVAQGPTPVWLPSAGMFSERGVLVSGYANDSDGSFAKLGAQGRLDASRASVERLHPGYGKELGKAIYVPWAKVPWNEGSWIESYGVEPPDAGTGVKTAAPVTSPVQKIGANYETLIKPDGPFYFAGEHVSHVPAWQEGAALSAKRVVGMIAERVKG